MRIGIVGNGVVGSATAEAFKSHEVRITDRLKSRETHQLSDVLESDLIFICLPTPQKKESMECDTTAIDSFFEYGLPARFEKANFVLRSTVPVGYTRMIREDFGLDNIVHSPEFLTARTAKEDACNPTRMIVSTVCGSECTQYLDKGSWKDDGNLYGAATCQYKLTQLYKSRWPTVPIYHMTSDESEFVKLFQNSLSAIKIAAFNEGYSFAQRKGLDWQRCLEALLAGGWINPMHTQVPGPDGKFGFGGSCLPKDVASLGFQLLQESLRADMMLGAYDRNLLDREK